MKIYANRCEPKTYSCECHLKNYVNRCEPEENIMWTGVNRKKILCEPVWTGARNYVNWCEPWFALTESLEWTPLHFNREGHIKEIINSCNTYIRFFEMDNKVLLYGIFVTPKISAKPNFAGGGTEIRNLFSPRKISEYYNKFSLSVQYLTTTSQQVIFWIKACNQN
jgi:hypothetical protein